MSKLVYRDPIIHIPTFKEYQVDGGYILNKVTELGLKVPMGLLDWSYHYTDLEGWGKVLYDLAFNSDLYKNDKFDCEIPSELTYALGLFFADGTCGLNNKGYNGASWNICNTKPELLEKCIKPLEQEWPELSFRIETYPSEAKGKETNYSCRNAPLYHLQVGIHHDAKRKPHRAGIYSQNYGCRGKFIQDFRTLFYLNGVKQVPPCIAESSNSSIKSFLEGAIDGDGYKKQRHLYVYGKTAVYGLVQLMDAIGWKSSIYPEKRKPNNFIIRYNPETENLNQINACENFALKAMNVCAERYGLNALVMTIGDMPLGRHGFNIFCYGTVGNIEGWLLWEPNGGFEWSGSPFNIGENGYFPDLVLL